MLANRSVPSSTVIPELVYDDVEAAVRWLCDVFGFSVRWQAGDHRAQLHVGAGAVVVRDEPPDAEDGSPVPPPARRSCASLSFVHDRAFSGKLRVAGQ
jgi:uncharacterized glyoxalase superfamily protein PhnB